MCASGHEKTMKKNHIQLLYDFSLVKVKTTYNYNCPSSGLVASHLWQLCVRKDIFLPNRVQNISILKYPEQFVVCGDFMEVGSLLIGKEQIWFPYGV